LLRFERLLGRRYLLRAQQRLGVLYWGLAFVVLAILLFFLRTYFENHISDLSDLNDLSDLGNQSWHVKQLQSLFGTGTDSQYLLRQVAQIVQVSAASSMALGICLSLFGVLYGWMTTFSAFSTFMVSMGVAEVILVLGVMNGFQGFLRQKLLDANAHITLEAKNDVWLSDYQQIVQEARQIEGVLGANPLIEAEVMIKIPDQETASAALLLGIDAKQAHETIFLDKFLKDGCGCLAYLDDPNAFHQKYALNPYARNDLANLLKMKDDDIITEEELCQECPSLGNSATTQQVPTTTTDQTHQTDQTASNQTMAFPKPSAKQVTPVVLMGAHLRYNLGLSLGQSFEVISHLGEIGPNGPMPRIKNFVLAGWLNSGLVEVDAHHAYTSLKSLQKFLSIGDVVSYIQIRVENIDVARDVKQRLQAHFKDRVVVKDWQEKNQGLFSALQLERIAMFLVLTINILLSAFSITSTLVMTILERKKEIAILKAMGATRRSILEIFLNQGIITGITGVSLGTLVGVGGAFLIGNMSLPSNVQELYYISAIPVEVKVFDVISIVVVAFLVSLLSTLYPAYYASGIEPLEGLKGK
jgi:lipoprotein-releasing system permease protein